MIFSHSWAVIVFPLLMWLADVACSVMIILITATLRTDALISTQKLLKPFLYSFFAVTIGLNCLTTGASASLTHVLSACPDPQTRRSYCVEN